LRRRRGAHQGRRVDHPARQHGGKGRLRPLQDLDGRAGQQQLGRRRPPQHLVDQAVGAVGAVGDAVAVQIEGSVVRPVVADAVGGPDDIAGADVLDLGAVADEGIAGAASAVEGKLEIDAVVAYLQQLGTLLQTRR